MSEIKYKRVLLKLSGEMLGGQEKRGIDISVLDEISNQIKRMLEAKAEVAIGFVIMMILDVALG